MVVEAEVGSRVSGCELARKDRDVAPDWLRV